MAIALAILAITSATQQQMAITSAKPGNKICQKKYNTPTMWHNNSHSSTTGAINKQKNNGNNISQTWQQHLPTTKSGNNISHKMAITSAKHGTINKQK